MKTQVGAGGGFIPKGAKNIEVAKDFMKYFMQPEVMNENLKGGLGRWVPAIPSLVKDDPFWLQSDMPCLKPYVEEAVLNPTLPVYEGLQPGLGPGQRRAALGPGTCRRDQERHEARGRRRQGLQALQRDLRQSRNRDPGEVAHERHTAGTRRSVTPAAAVRSRRGLVQRPARRRLSSGRLRSPCPTSRSSSPSSSIRSLRALDGQRPALYRDLFADPRYLTAVINTLLYVGDRRQPEDVPGVPAVRFLHAQKLVDQGLLVVFILPWATPALPAYISIHWFLNGQWGMLNNVLYMLFGIDGPVYLNDHWTGLACNIGAYIWKTLAVLDDHPAGRPDGGPDRNFMRPPAVDGATGLRRFAHVTCPLMANLYLVCTLLDMVFALGDFNATYFVSGGGPAMSTEVLATLGIRYAFTVALPRLGVADGDVRAAAC